MRDRMERFVLLPFSIGCVSESSVDAIAVDKQHRRKNYKPDTKSTSPASRRGRNKEEDEESHSSSTESMKSNMKFPNISPRIHRLFKSFKSFSQLFVYKEEIEEVEMEIGFPTDVKHVTHIGWDGSTTTNPMRGWDNLVPPQLLSSSHDHEYEYDPQSAPAASFLQFELSMATQAARAPPPIINKY